MKPVIARGTKLPLAVEGFTSAEQFATLAHAARNTQVPFILLKHRVLTEGQSLEEAILASKPDIDARMEVNRARDEARSDMQALATPNVAAAIRLLIRNQEQGFKSSDSAKKKAPGTFPRGPFLYFSSLTQSLRPYRSLIRTVRTTRSNASL